MRSLIRRPLTASAMAVAVTAALVLGASAAVTPEPVPSEQVESVEMPGALAIASQPELDWADAQPNGQLIYTIDQEQYRIGYTARFDMVNYVRAWNVLREQSIAAGVQQTEKDKNDMNWAIGMYNGHSLSNFFGKIAPINWDAPDNTAALRSINTLNGYAPFIASRVPARYKDIFTRFISEADFRTALASRADARQYWETRFDKAKLASELEVSFKIDPAKAQVNPTSLADPKLWQNAFTNANVGSSPAASFATLMQIYAVDYVAAGDNKTLRDGSVAPAGTVIIKLRLSSGNQEAAYESEADYQAAVAKAQAIQRPATAAQRTEAAADYAANNTRSVQATLFNNAINGADGNKAYSDAAWTQPVNEADELTELRVVTPEGFLTVTERTARSLDWRTDASTETIDASSLKVLGDMRMPIVDDANLQSILVQKNGVNGTLPYSFSSDQKVSYKNERPAGILFDFKAVLANGSDDQRPLPTEVSNLKPDVQVVDTYDDLTNVQLPQPAQTVVSVQGGQWEFVSYKQPLSEAKWTTHKAADMDTEEQFSADHAKAKYVKVVGQWLFKSYATPAAPTVNPADCGVRKTVNIPDDPNFVYAESASGDSVTVTATPAHDIVIAPNATVRWELNVAADACPVEIPVPNQPEINDPCGAGNAQWMKPENSEQITWSLTTDNHLVATAQPGFTFPNAQTTHDFGVAPEANTDACVVQIELPDTPDVNAVCGSDNDTWVKPADTEHITWTLNEERMLIASTAAGYAFTDGSTTHNYGVAPEQNSDPCPPNEVAPEAPEWGPVVPCGQKRDVLTPGETEQYAYSVSYSGKDSNLMTVTATAKDGYVFAGGEKTKVWEFDRTPQPCPPQTVEYTEPTLVKQSCGQKHQVTVPANTEKVTYVESVSGNTVTVTATAMDGYVFAGADKVKSWEFDVTPEKCPVETPLIFKVSAKAPVVVLPEANLRDILLSGISGGSAATGSSTGSTDLPSAAGADTAQASAAGADTAQSMSEPAVVKAQEQGKRAGKVVLAKTGVDAPAVAGLAALLAMAGVIVMRQRQRI